jgi:hypothetical protein
MCDIVELPITSWQPGTERGQQKAAVQALERGNVLHFPQLAFALSAGGQRAMTAAVRESNKNASFDPARGQLRGSTAAPADQPLLADMLGCFGNGTVTLLDGLFPGYGRGRKQGRTSFRPVGIEGRKTSWRKVQPSSCRQLSGDADPGPAHPARVQQHQPARPGPPLAPRRAFRGGRRVLHARVVGTFAGLGCAARDAPHHQDAAQRLRPLHAAATRRHEGRCAPSGRDAAARA